MDCQNTNLGNADFSFRSPNKLLREYLKESISQRIEHFDQALVKHKD